MKKFFSWMLVLSLLCAVCATAAAEEETNVYDLLTKLLGGKRATLTLTPENITGDEDVMAPFQFAAITCTAMQSGEQLTLTVTRTAPDAFLTLTLTAEGVTLDTDLWAQETVRCDWAALAPRVTCTTDDAGATLLKVSMTGPDQELINFSCKVSGADAHSYMMEFNGGFITAGGSVYSLWDSVSADGDAAVRDFAFTYGEDELVVEAAGTQTVAEGIARAEECTVLLNDDEVGGFTLSSVWTIE